MQSTKSYFIKGFFTLFIFFFSGLFSFAQKMQHPVKWTCSAKKITASEYKVEMRAKIEPKWHLYSQYQVYKDGEGPLSALVTINADEKKCKLIGKVTESKSLKEMEPSFGVEVSYFENQAVFTQKLKRLTNDAFKINGVINYQACIDVCVNEEEKFEVEIEKSTEDINSTAEEKVATTAVAACVCDTQAILKTALVKKDTSTSQKSNVKDTVSSANTSSTVKTGVATGGVETKSLWSLFLAGFVGGLLALLTPCIYSMIPLTVSFFTKQSKTRAKGIRNALIYGLSIILIYDVFTLIISAAFGSDAPNIIASNVGVNLFFFAIFMVFAFSFLGAFEITLPASWVSKADSASERGGLIGIFFMAFTLVLVSFSCTGPVVGSLLKLISDGTYLRPLVGMTGFGLCLALPFALFAIFPGWINSMPKSGGWLNSVKVVLGILEVALAMKFLSNADMVAHWHLLSRETFISIWVVCFGLMGFYLLGKLKFAHDSDLPHLSVTRTMLAIIVLSFTLYLIPGIWGAPLNLISGFPPPQSEEWSENVNAFSGSQSASYVDPAKTSGTEVKHHEAGCPKGLENCFHDYDEALAYARQVKKPLMIDFTGWTCVNCRKMEQQVWIKPEVLRLLRDEYVLVSLYTDERGQLPEAKKTISAITGKPFETYGQKWSELESSRYACNTQPLYVLLDNNEKKLMEPVSVTSVADYLIFLNGGLEEYKKRK